MQNWAQLEPLTISHVSLPSLAKSQDFTVWLHFIYYIKTASPHVQNHDDFSRLFEIASQMLARHCLYLAPRVNGHAYSFSELNEVDFFF